MPNWKHEIATGAIINGAIIARIDQLPDVRAIANSIAPGYPLTNAAHISGLMFSIFVVGFEIYEKDPKFLDFLKTYKLSDRFDQGKSTAKENPPTSLDFLKCLRNAVAHVLYEIEPDATHIHFRNERNRFADWRASCTREDLLECLLQLGDAMHKRYMAIRGLAAAQQGAAADTS